LRTPFPWYGGKTKVAKPVWRRLGNVRNYIEPFFGAGAVLLNRPTKPRLETVNDKDCFIANFFRAVQQDVDAVIKYADWPVNGADLWARNKWLCGMAENLIEDPDFCDPKVAGWWVWGQGCWIGSGWACSNKMSRPDLTPKGIHRIRPHLGRPMGVTREEEVGLYLKALWKRMRYVRVCCGDWEQICNPDVMAYAGMTGVLFDPPYSEEADRDNHIYREEDLAVAHRVREWCLANADNKNIRIALCGYEEEHKMPDDWEVLVWRAGGGGATKADTPAKRNRLRERIWFSPSCLKPQRGTLF